MACAVGAATSLRSITRKDFEVDKWTNKDEAELQRLINRKEEIKKRNFAPLVDLVVRANVQSYSNREIAEWMISQACSIRDALDPFDSGVREQKETPFKS